MKFAVAASETALQVPFNTRNDAMLYLIDGIASGQLKMGFDGARSYEFADEGAVQWGNPQRKFFFCSSARADLPSFVRTRSNVRKVARRATLFVYDYETLRCGPLLMIDNINVPSLGFVEAGKIALHNKQVPRCDDETAALYAEHCDTWFDPDEHEQQQQQQATEPTVECASGGGWVSANFSTCAWLQAYRRLHWLANLSRWALLQCYRRHAAAVGERLLPVLRARTSLVRSLYATYNIDAFAPFYQHLFAYQTQEAPHDWFTIRRFIVI